MKLSRANRKWWDLANARRQKLIVKKYRRGGLTSEEVAEFKMLQRVAEAVCDYASTDIFGEGADPFGFKKLAKDIREGKLARDPETERLAKKAIESIEANEARRAKMTPEELKADNEAWATRLAADIGRFTD